jgi:hypothetical protein
VTKTNQRLLYQHWSNSKKRFKTGTFPIRMLIA